MSSGKRILSGILFTLLLALAALGGRPALAAEIRLGFTPPITGGSEKRLPESTKNNMEFHGYKTIYHHQLL